MRFAFGDLVVDTERFVIQRDGRPVDVQPQVFDVLAYLLEHRDRVVPKEELLDEIWGDRFVSESALTSRIKSARQLVGDDGVSQTCIKTSHGRGYRWVADVHVLASSPQRHREEHSDASALIAPPVSITPLIGRRAEIAAMISFLEERRLTTAVGPPGVGKSRLVAEVARVVADSGREVAFVDLRLANDRRDVPRLVERAIGASGRTSPAELRSAGGTDDDMFDQLVEHLRSRTMLLVLDNCEHVVATVGELAFDLLGRCPHLGLVATSQRRLGVVGESVVVVDPLDAPAGGTASMDAIVATAAGRLFVDRSIAAGARWTGSREEAGLIAEVCRRLDGLPLAIELAAPRTRWLGLADLLRQLDRELGPDGADPLHAALRMSRGLLADGDARAFDALSVFAGSFTLDAALAVVEAVCPNDDAVSVFSRLVDHSLVDVSAGEPRRYRLLETIQRYAELCRLGSEVGDASVRAHAQYFLQFVSARWPSGRVIGEISWEVLGQEMPEVLAAVERAIDDDPGLARQLIGAIGWYWSIGGYAEQCEAYADQLSRRRAADSPAVEAAFHWARANARLLLGLDPVESASRAHALAVEAGSWSVAAWSLAHVIAPDMMWADLPVVESRWDEVVELFRRGNDPVGEAWAMVFVLGWAEACAQLRARATNTYERAAVLLERHGDRRGAARALLEVVELNSWSGFDLDVARSTFARIPDFDDASLEFRTKRLWLEGHLAGMDGDWDAAIRCHTRAVDLWDRFMPASILASTHRCLLGWTMRWAGRPGEAAQRFALVLSTLPRAGAPRRWAGHSVWVIESVAGLLAEMGAAEAAARLMAAAHRARRELDAPMPHWDRPRYEPDLQRAREQLDDGAFDAAWAAGLGLDLPAALDLAAHELAPYRD